MIERFSEHGEEKIIESFFNKKLGGIVLEVGARNGITDSNSRDLIKNYTWTGILIEPDRRQFLELCKNYEKSDRVFLFNNVLGEKSGKEIVFHIVEDSGSHPSAGHGTYSESFKNRAERMSKIRYTKSETMITKTMTEILLSLGITKVDYISIDCEGTDLEVLEGLDLNVIDVSMISIEPSAGTQIVTRIFDSKGYRLYNRTRGNVFYVKK